MECMLLSMGAQGSAAGAAFLSVTRADNFSLGAVCLPSPAEKKNGYHQFCCPCDAIGDAPESLR